MGMLCDILKKFKEKKSMAYTPALPNRFDEALIPFKVRQRYFEEYLGLSPLTVFMGTSASDAIQVFETQNGEGLSYRVSFRKDLNYETPVIGFDQAAGAEQPIEIFEDEIKMNIQRFVDMLMGVPLTRKMTPLDVYEAMRPLLMNAQRRNLVKSVLDSGTIGLYTPTGGGNGPQKDRVVYGGVNYNAKIHTAVGTMTGATYDKSGLSVAHLRQLKSMAINGGTAFEKESRIKPMELRTKKGFPEELYVYLMDTDSYVSLSKDPEWKDFVYRGVIQSKDQPEGLSGARYRGQVEGIMVYECPELSRYRVTNTHVAAWNMLLGAQAFGLCWAQRPWFEMEQRDFNLNVAMAVCEIRGQKALMFPSFQDNAKLVERGIIHSFVQIA
jgi:hypothetical protein